MIFPSKKLRDRTPCGLDALHPEDAHNKMTKPAFAQGTHDFNALNCDVSCFHGFKSQRGPDNPL